jgi:hypothetical protein
VFEHLRQSLNELLDRATKPEDRRTIVARMKNTLVQATIGLDDLRNAHRMLEKKLEMERKELETVKRRRELAVGINDAETVKVAERFEKQHQEKVALMEEKLDSRGYGRVAWRVGVGAGRGSARGGSARGARPAVRGPDQRRDRRALARTRARGS